MLENEAAGSHAPLREGKELARDWADAEARLGVRRVAYGMLLLALALVLARVLAPNPDVSYTVGAGHSVGVAGWSGLIPPFPPAASAGATVTNWLGWLIAFLVTVVGALCRFLSIASVVSRSSPVVDAVLYGVLAAALLAWKSRAAAGLLLTLAAAGLVISALRLGGVMTGASGNVIVSLFAFVGGLRACQVTSAYHARAQAGG